MLEDQAGLRVAGSGAAVGGGGVARSLAFSHGACSAFCVLCSAFCVLSYVSVACVYAAAWVSVLLQEKVFACDALPFAFPVLLVVACVRVCVRTPPSPRLIAAIASHHASTDLFVLL